MLKYELVQSTEKVKVIAVICDKCKNEIPKNDSFEYQECYRISFQGGYGSIFGDSDEIECDLCQHCLMELIKPYYRNLSE
jgi:hypothetical protein